MTNSLIIFAKYPRPGEVKTRLAAETSPEFAAETYSHFISRILKNVRHTAANIRVYVGKKEDCAIFNTTFNLPTPSFPQCEGNLGDRIIDAFKTTFKTGVKKAITIGTDSPDLPPHFYQDAFDALNTHDTVIGPALDGGYYLFGCRNTTFTPSFFESIHWSTQTVLNETIAQIKKATLSVKELPKWRDVDTLADLQQITITPTPKNL